MSDYVANRFDSYPSISPIAGSPKRISTRYSIIYLICALKLKQKGQQSLQEVTSIWQSPRKIEGASKDDDLENWVFKRSSGSPHRIDSILCSEYLYSFDVRTCDDIDLGPDHRYVRASIAFPKPDVPGHISRKKMKRWQLNLDESAYVPESAYRLPESEYTHHRYVGPPRQRWDDSIREFCHMRSPHFRSYRWVDVLTNRGPHTLEDEFISFLYGR